LLLRSYISFILFIQAFSEDTGEEANAYALGLSFSFLFVFMFMGSMLALI